MVLVGQAGKLVIKDTLFSGNFVPQARYANLTKSELLMGAAVMAQAVPCAEDAELPTGDTIVQLQGVQFSPSMTNMMRENAVEFQALFYTDDADALVSTVEHPITCLDEPIYMSQATSMPAVHASQAPKSERLPSMNDAFIVRMKQDLEVAQYHTVEGYQNYLNMASPNGVVYCAPSTAVGANESVTILRPEGGSGGGITLIALIATSVVLALVLLAGTIICALYIRKRQHKRKTAAPEDSQPDEPPLSQVIPQEEEVIRPSIVSEIDSTSAHLAREEAVAQQLTAPTEQVSSAVHDTTAPAAFPRGCSGYENEGYHLFSSECQVESTVASAVEVLSSWSSLERNREPPRQATRVMETPQFRMGAFKPSQTARDEQKVMNAMMELITEGTIICRGDNRRRIQVCKTCKYRSTDSALVCKAKSLGTPKLYLVCFFTSKLHMERYRASCSFVKWPDNVVLQRWVDNIKFHPQDNPDDLIRNGQGEVLPPFSICKRFDSLHERVRECNMERYTAFQVAGQVASCLALLHSQGLAHRNVSFDTIVFKNQGWTLAGFDHAAPIGQSAQLPERASYTMDPEQVAAFKKSEHYELSRAALDVWALGCVVRECLVKKQLFGRVDSTFDMTWDIIINCGAHLPVVESGLSPEESYMLQGFKTILQGIFTRRSVDRLTAQEVYNKLLAHIKRSEMPEASIQHQQPSQEVLDALPTSSDFARDYVAGSARVQGQTAPPAACSTSIVPLPNAVAPLTLQNLQHAHVLGGGYDVFPSSSQATVTMPSIAVDSQMDVSERKSISAYSMESKRPAGSYYGGNKGFAPPQTPPPCIGAKPRARPPVRQQATVAPRLASNNPQLAGSGMYRDCPDSQQRPQAKMVDRLQELAWGPT